MLGDVDGMILLDSLQDPKKLGPNDDWVLQFIVGKNRNGPNTRREVLFYLEHMKFRNLIRR